jgi:hypothetical protein
VSPLTQGFLALALLALLPGMLVARAPWTAVPALSLAFWALSAWWPLPGRGRALAAGLVAFGLLALLRLLPKHEVPAPPGWRPSRAPAPPPRRRPPRATSGASLLVVAVALALMAPVPLWHHAPGPRLAFQTTTARLLLWRDGIPATAEPLLTLAPVGAHAPALATLAADVSRLSGLDPAGSMLLVVVAAAGLLLVGLFALHATWAPPWAAALGAVGALGAMPWPATLSAWGEGEALLALALALPAVALVVGHVSRSSAVAAGMLLAAAALSQPLLCAVLLLAVALGRRGGAGRLALACVLALILAGPGLWPLAQALSAREGVALARAVRPGELAALAIGLALAASLPLALVPLAEPRSRAGRLARAGLAVLGAALLVARLHGWVGSGQLSPHQREALARASIETRPLEVLCAPEALRNWVPALAGRAAGPPGPWVPPVYAEEWAARIARPCGARLEESASSP